MPRLSRLCPALAVPVAGLLLVACAAAGPSAAPSTSAAPTGTTSAPAPTAGSSTSVPPTPAARPSVGCRTPVGAAGTETRTLSTPTGDRTYRLTRPAGAAAVPAPLVLLFHGHGSDAEGFTTLTTLPARGAEAGMVVVTPDGTGIQKTWQFSGQGTDAAFVDALIDEVTATTCVDLDRIGGAGFSAGAAFTIAYACARPDRIHAIVTVAVEFQLGCTAPLSILAFHGTRDVSVPYENEAVGLSLPGVKVRGTELNMADWAALGRCDATPRVEPLDTEVTRSTWTGCAPGTEVSLHTVIGGGHSWPGADPGRSIGLTTQQIDATALALAFLARAHVPPS